MRPKKLSPKFVGPYQILRKIGPVAYELSLPPQLSNLHPVFHVSQLRKYIADPSHILELEDVRLRQDRTLEMQPVHIEDSDTKYYKRKAIRMVKVVWDEKTGDTTWEVEDAMRDLNHRSTPDAVSFNLDRTDPDSETEGEALLEDVIEEENLVDVEVKAEP
ncbi:uncharacterized protein LOC108334897 [Vigna angularis]|uniref:uncharacterized protein LOC108334897 n=1 Tax=Phaseolus angularis TaxID=3914 RepID=UPI000809E98C|nr:uncharacterized protein LOC108334897 [Vigna angularis]